LAAREISAQFLSQFETDIAACKASVGKANEMTNQIRLATEAESEARDALLAALKEIQTAAKQKYARNAPLRMKDYLVSERLDPNRAALVQAADSILAKLTSDTLPGITPAKVTGLKTLRDAYVGANAAQADAQSKASTEREAIESAVASIADRRVQIQFAAEAEWPSDDKANAPIRREFVLPPDRPFRG
jgi:chromosome segregation ATPase